jgi:hypothetical protein
LESPHGPCINQLPTSSVNHQMVVPEKVYTQDGKLHVRQQEDPRKGDTVEVRVNSRLPQQKIRWPSGQVREGPDGGSVDRKGNTL